jgi:hypothetical protein
MKIKFQVSQTTNLEPSIIIDRILILLKDKKYRIQEVTDNSITFDDDPWVLRWNFQQIRRLDGGRFEICASDGSKSVSFKCYLDILQTLLLLSAILIFLIVQWDYTGLLFLGLFILIVGSIQITTSKDVAREMVREILSEDCAS